MSVLEAIKGRRSIKKFSDRPVAKETVEALLQSATHAPNHRLTQPWRFYVLGPAARRGYGLALGNRKARKIEDPAAADSTREKVAEEHRALPCMIAVAVTQDDNPEIREEDYAATMMAVQNLALAAVEAGLGTHFKTGAVMEDPAARAAAGVGERERIVMVVNLGYPAEVPPAKPRKPLEEVAHWLD